MLRLPDVSQQWWKVTTVITFTQEYSEKQLQLGLQVISSDLDLAYIQNMYSCAWKDLSTDRVFRILPLYTNSQHVMLLKCKPKGSF